MADVQFVTPSSPFDPAAELNIKRRRKMADAMMKAGEQPQSTEMVSGMAVKQSPMAALARALTQGVAGYQEGQADKEDATVQTNRQKMMADAIGQVGTNPNGAAAMLAQTPETAPQGMQIALEMMKDKKALELAQFKADHGGEGGVPASIKITQEIEKRLKAGDIAGANLLTQAAKMYDRGVNAFSAPDPNGLPIPDMPTPPVGGAAGKPPALPVLAPKAIAGYGDAVGGIKGTIKGNEQDAKNKSDRTWVPGTAAETQLEKDQAELKNARNLTSEKKLGEQQPDATAGSALMDSIVNQAEGVYNDLDKQKAITNTQNSTGQNVSASVRGSPVGQYLAKKAGTAEQSNRNKLEMMRPALINAIRQSTGMSSKSMDSNNELQFYLKMATDPSADIQANRTALKYLKDTYGLGGAMMQKFGNTGVAQPLPNQTPAPVTKNWVIKDGKLVPQ